VIDHSVGGVLLQPVDQCNPQVFPFLGGARVLFVEADVPEVPFSPRARTPAAPSATSPRPAAARMVAMRVSTSAMNSPARILASCTGHAVVARVLLADILRDELAGLDRAGTGVTWSSHAKRHLYRPFVLRAVQMSV